LSALIFERACGDSTSSPYSFSGDSLVKDAKAAMIDGAREQPLTTTR
jgi:hypothetical protein